jgi:hypothetical protein
MIIIVLDPGPAMVIEEGKVIEWLFIMSGKFQNSILMESLQLKQKPLR